MTIETIIPSFSMLFLIIAWSPAQPAEKIMVSYSSRTYAFLPAQVAAAKGFFK
jgi:hypothetical protein